MDFTLKTYKSLLHTLKSNDYSFQTMEQFSEKPLDRVIIMRHDVDRKQHNSISMTKFGKDLVYKFKSNHQKKMLQISTEIMRGAGNRYCHELTKNYSTIIYDVNTLAVLLVENYPESVKIMKENPDYQNRFK